MSFVISKIGSQRKHYVDMKNGDPHVVASINERMLTVEQYHDLARGIISRWAPPHVKKRLLRSEDAVAYVAHNIMMADWGYQPDKSSIKTYRGARGKYAIKDYLDGLTKQYYYENLYDADTDLVDITCPPPSHGLEMTERYQDIRHTLSDLLKKLPAMKRICVIMYFIQQKSTQDIGRIFGVSQEWARENIRQGIEEMRVNAHVATPGRSPFSFVGS